MLFLKQVGLDRFDAQVWIDANCRIKEIGPYGRRTWICLENQPTLTMNWLVSTKTGIHESDQADRHKSMVATHFFTSYSWSGKENIV